MTEHRFTIMQVPMSSPHLGEREICAVIDVLSTPVLSMGPKIVSFEQAVCTYCGVKHAIAVNSGTSGLHLAVIAAGVKEGDLVITSPFSFIASANCILYERAIPVFVDCDPITGNIDPDLAEQSAYDLNRRRNWRRWLPPNLRNSMTRIGQLKVLLPVHAFGQPADMDPLIATAFRYSLVVIEDSCEAIGAEYKGRRAGTMGDVAVFAFYPNKQITTGEGGMLVTERTDWDVLFRSLRNQGREGSDGWLSHTRLGYNYRMDEMSAALGVVQMSRIEELLAKREQVARWYNERLREGDLVEIPCITPTTTRMSWFVYVVRINSAVSRDAVIGRLAEDRIASKPYFKPIHLQRFYREEFGYKEGDFPATEHLGRVSLALPFSSVMTESQVDLVCGKLRSAVRAELNEASREKG